MSTQKQEILEYVAIQKVQKKSVKKIIATLGVSSTSYYRWRQESATGQLSEQKIAINPRSLTTFEKERILAVKTKNPELRHRRIQGELQKEGLFISATSVYKELRENSLIEPYLRRPSPWDEPQYEIWGKCKMWGTDWTRLKINHVRWYLLTLIDFFSRKIVAFDVVGNVNAGHIKELYLKGLDAENIPLNCNKPKLRADRGSPNTSEVTQNFFKEIGADLSWARVRRPTDNAITERFYGTIKQEEIYLVGSYPDLQSAKEEIGKYIRFYNEERPHQSLWNFTPEQIHEMNNKTEAKNILHKLKIKTWSERKKYWNNKNNCYSQKN